MPYLDGVLIKPQTLLFVNQKQLHIFALVSLQLDYLPHLSVVDDVAIAGELLFDHTQNLLLVKFLGQALDGGQGFAAIALCAGVNVSKTAEKEVNMVMEIR